MLASKILTVEFICEIISLNKTCNYHNVLPKSKRRSPVHGVMLTSRLAFSKYVLPLALSNNMTLGGKTDPPGLGLLFSLTHHRSIIRRCPLIRLLRKLSVWWQESEPTTRGCWSTRWQNSFQLLSCQRKLLVTNSTPLCRCDAPPQHRRLPILFRRHHSSVSLYFPRSSQYLFWKHLSEEQQWHLLN